MDAVVPGVEMAKPTGDESGSNAVVLETTHLIGIVWDKLLGWIESFVAMLPNLVVALVILIVFALLARFGRRIVTKSIRRAHVNEQLAVLAGIVTRVSFLGLGLFLALGILELQKTAMSLLAGVGVIGLALGFAFQDIASNFMSGVIMALRRPFEIGELIETGGTMGFVQEVSLRSTIVRNFSGNLVIIPNKDVLQSPIVNYSREGERRIEVAVGIAYDSDLERAREIATEAVRDIAGLDASKDVGVIYTDFGDSSVNMEVQYWLDLDDPDADYLEARSEGILAIHSAFEEAGIVIPFPIRTIEVVDRGDGEGASEEG